MNSRLSPGERYDQMMRAKNGELDVMIGPRSALFTPFPDLGLIVIDEEHESAYKEIRINDNVQLELGEVSVVLACLSPGTTKEHIDNLIHAFEKLSKKHRKSEETDIPSYHYSYPRMIVPPRDAYDAPHKIVPLTNCTVKILCPLTKRILFRAVTQNSL